MSSNTVARTSAGMVEGVVNDEVIVFRGIPYGAPTGGQNRFRPPQPPVAWTGLRDCSEFGLQCPQPTFELADLIGVRKAPSSEDCLTLNVYAPALDDGERPVMVWYHGGGLTIGSGNTYDGTRLAGRNDVVVVTVNHRLGLLGYLRLDEVAGDEWRDSGNAAVLDMIAALEWVRDNARAFGGDPENVTIFGESGGGAKVCSLLASPRAEGLFHRAIIQSGPMTKVVEPEDAAATTAKFMAHVGASSVQDLVAMDADDFVAAQVEVLGGPLGGAGALGPVRDGRTVVRNPFDPDASPSATRVPVLIGTTRDEMAQFMAGVDPESFDEEQLRSGKRDLFGDDPEDVIAAYRALRPDATPFDLHIAIGTDRMRVASIRIAERIARAGGTAFMFRFDFTSPMMGGKYSPHFIEVPFVFDQLDGNMGLRLHGDRQDGQPLADAVSRAWAQFARTGDPNHDGLPRWPAYDEKSRATMLFDVESRVEEDPNGEERAVWPEDVQAL